MFKKILIGIIAFGIIAALLLQIDDDLNPEIAAVLKQAEPAESSEAYLYFLGIMAAEGEDPLEVGKQLFAAIQQAEKQYSLDDDQKLALPQGEFFCSGWDEDCWNTIFSNKDDIHLVLQANVTLLDRYQTFLQLDDYHTLAKPSSMAVSDVFLLFSYLEKANKLVILKAINTAQTANPEKAINALSEHVTALKKQLKSADNLIGKMSYILRLDESLDALSVIIHKNSSVYKGTISPLSLAERDFSTVLSREFASGYEHFSMMGEDSSGNSRGWLVKAEYKPNMTINEAYELHKERVVRWQVKQTEFVPKPGGVQRPTFRWSKIRNHFGSFLNDITPNFDDSYIELLFDLNAKMALFKQTANKAELPLDLDDIENPYYDKKGTAYYSNDGKSICLTGPIDDDEHRRCLRVKL